MKVFDYYGMAEHAASAAECPAGSYHVGAEHNCMVIIYRRFRFHEVPAAREVQVIQEELNRFRMKVVPNPGYTGEDSTRIARMVQDAVRFPAAVAVEQVAQIPPHHPRQVPAGGVPRSGAPLDRRNGPGVRRVGRAGRGRACPTRRDVLQSRWREPAGWPRRQR